MTQKLTAQELVPFGQNLLLNSTFAMGLAGWNVSGGSTDWRVKTNPYGVHCYGTGWLAQRLNTTGNTSYTLSATLENMAEIYVVFWDASWNNIGETQRLYSTTTGMSITFTTPSNCVKLDVTIYSKQSAGNTAGTFVNNIKLERGSIATPYTNEGDVYALNGKFSGWEFTPTLINGWNYKYIPSCELRNDIVYLSMVVQNNGINTSGAIASDIFNLPAVCHPSDFRIGSGVVVNASNATTRNAVSTVVRPSGSVSLQCMGLGNTNSEYHFTMSYLID